MGPEDPLRSDVTQDPVVGRDERVLPRSVVYDPELTVSLPAGLSATSGINAGITAACSGWAYRRPTASSPLMTC